MNWLDARISYIRRVTAPGAVLDTPTIREALGKIKSRAFAASVEPVRRIADQAERQEAKKRLLPFYTFSGRFPYRANDRLETHSGAVSLDFDHAEDLGTLKADVTARPYVGAAFVSTSGDGLKVLVPIRCTDAETGEERPPRDDAEHKQAWEAVARLFSAASRDDGCSDVSRACFVSVDPDAYVNAEAVPVEVTLSTSNTHARAAGGSGPRGVPRTLGETIPHGRQHHTLVSLAGTLRRRGLQTAEIASCLLEVNKRCERPGTEAAMWEIAESMMRYAPEEAPSAAARAAVEAPPVGFGVVLSAVKRERVVWLWKGRLAVGKLTILDGNPGTGKSVFYLDCAARITTGRAFPDEETVPPGREPAGVVIVTTEDGIADTIAPRAAVAGADLTRVSVIQLIPEADGPGRVPVLPDDVEIIMGECARIGAQLLVIDPLMAHLGGETNSYKDSDIRRALAPLAEAAERYGVAVLVVRHLNKAPGGDPLYRGGGSIGIIGAARIGLMLGRDPEREDSLALACTKINVGASPGSLALSIQPSAEDPDLPVIEWAGRSSLTARDLCASPERGESKTEAAEAWLLDVLAAGPRSSNDLISEGKAAGFSRRTLFRAKDALGVEAKKLGFAGEWEWRLPEGLKGRSVPKGASSTDGTLRHASGGGDGVAADPDSFALTASSPDPWDGKDPF